MWFYNGKELKEVPSGVVGFVYEITNLMNNRKYIGKKNVFFSRKKKVKGRVNRKTVKKESDWADYYGSNDELLQDVETHGKDKFHREILHLCKTKGEMSYMELKCQMQNEVLERPDEYYNRWIYVRVASSHIKKLYEKVVDIE